MKRVLLFVLVFCAMATMASAQTTGVPGQKFSWDQPAQDLATAQAYTYKHTDDGGATTVFAAGSVTCTGTASPFQCEVSIPAYTPGPHSVTVQAMNIAGDSQASDPLAFTFVVTPGKPVNLHIK